MKRSELEHVIRASGAIADDDEIIVIGSQSVLGQFPDAPARLLTSMETEIYPKNKSDLAAMVDGSIGEGFSFTLSLVITRKVSVRLRPCCQKDGRSDWLASGTKTPTV